jgi:hypothetical protein
MSGTEALIDRLIAVDDFIAQGLAGYDRLMARLNAEEVAKATRKMRRDGLGDDGMEAFAEQREEATKQARSELVEQLTTRAFELYMSNDLPESVLNDFRVAGAMVRGCLEGVESALPFACPERRRELHRDLWRPGFLNVMTAREGANLRDGDQRPKS